MTPGSDPRLLKTQIAWTKNRNFKPDLIAIPPVEENMHQFDAGRLLIGVEDRRFTNDILRAHVGSNTKMVVPETTIDDGGISFHVFEQSSGVEYLRFDCFRDNPHYHYLVPGIRGVVVIPYDRIANGAMESWVLVALRSRMPELLRGAGGFDLADGVSLSDLDMALDNVQELVSSLAHEGAA